MGIRGWREIARGRDARKLILKEGRVLQERQKTEL
jgi:hypothetical protein